LNISIVKSNINAKFNNKDLIKILFIINYYRKVIKKGNYSKIRTKSNKSINK